MVSIPELLKRADQERWMNHPEETQKEVLKSILKRNESTLFGREHLFSVISDRVEFQKCVPLSTYSDLKPYIQAMVSGKEDILVREPFHLWMRTAEMSGREKLLPCTGSVISSFQEAFLRLYTICAAEGMVTEEGKVISGLDAVYTRGIRGIPVACSSFLAFLALKKIPILGKIFVPSSEIIRIANWEKRFMRIAAQVKDQDVTAAVTDPLLFLVLLRKMMTEYRFLDIIDFCELWPNFSLIISGKSMDPYRAVFCSIFQNVEFRQFFCADGVPIAIQVDRKQGCTPLYDQNFLEFIPLIEWRAMEREEGICREYEFAVETAETTRHGEEYVLVLTTPGGLYRYIPGDIVKVLGGSRIAWSGWIEEREIAAEPQERIALKKVAADSLELRNGNGSQIIAVESEALTLFGIK